MTLRENGESQPQNALSRLRQAVFRKGDLLWKAAILAAALWSVVESRLARDAAEYALSAAASAEDAAREAVDSSRDAAVSAESAKDSVSEMAGILSRMALFK